MAKQCYNWEENRLRFKDSNNKEYDIKLRGNITVVNGDSASGKSLVVHKLSEFKARNNKGMTPYSIDNIFIVNMDNKDKILEQHDKLIIIDRAEMIMTPDLAYFINRDSENRYLVYSRAPIGIEVSPNYYANMIDENGVLKIRYLYSVKGWF